MAIKKIRLGNYREGINLTAIREIKLLKELRHPHVIELVDCFPHKRNLNLVFECCESDLEAVIKDKFIPLGTPEIKSYMAMTLHSKYFHWSENIIIGPISSIFETSKHHFSSSKYVLWTTDNPYILQRFPVRASVLVISKQLP